MSRSCEDSRVATVRGGQTGRISCNMAECSSIISMASRRSEGRLQAKSIQKCLVSEVTEHQCRDLSLLMGKYYSASAFHCGISREI